ncbi:MAG TPA: rhomboid family intramembrane serine protease [Candidatus Limnocylindrales bacterium]|nr:rhomboid family intramembrane serine protease [Candidatus Limnocylindrales bacterium]
MDDPRPPDLPDPSRPGRLSRQEALALLAGGDAMLAAGDYPEAAVRFSRVVGFEDATLTAAALLGLGEARFRLGQDDAAVASWRAVLQVGETPSSYAAWRNIAAASVRQGDLRGAIGAYREAERRAPSADRAEIANRLGWLTKEIGDESTARRYFARGRGDAPLLSVTTILIAATVIVSLSAILSSEGLFLYNAFQLDKDAVAAGEYWRLWTVTLLHGSPDPGFFLPSLAHLFFNMYALYLAGPIVERWYGGLRFLVFYLACAAGGSVASFVFGGPQPSVGASGAIFGLFGLLLAANGVHHPVDRQSRMLVGQLGVLILINILFGFSIQGIDNAAHIGGLVTGLWLGAMLQPTRVQTLDSMWGRLRETALGQLARVPWAIPTVALGTVVIVVVAGLIVGPAFRAA